MTQYSLVGKHVNRCNIKCLFSQELHFLCYTIFPSTHYNTVTKFLTALQGRLLYCMISHKISIHSAGLEFHPVSLLQPFSAWRGKVCAHIVLQASSCIRSVHQAMAGLCTILQVHLLTFLPLQATAEEAAWVSCCFQ